MAGQPALAFGAPGSEREDLEVGVDSPGSDGSNRVAWIGKAEWNGATKPETVVFGRRNGAWRPVNCIPSRRPDVRTFFQLQLRSIRKEKARA